jgi:hypothetical protein
MRRRQAHPGSPPAPTFTRSPKFTQRSRGLAGCSLADGAYGDVRLDWQKAFVAAKCPGAIHEGNGMRDPLTRFAPPRSPPPGRRPRLGEGRDEDRPAQGRYGVSNVVMVASRITA